MISPIRYRLNSRSPEMYNLWPVIPRRLLTFRRVFSLSILYKKKIGKPWPIMLLPVHLARVIFYILKLDCYETCTSYWCHRFLRELQESVECPVCFSIPRCPPVPCCQNGHVICAKCKEKVDVCPTCRIPMTNCVSQVKTGYSILENAWRWR